ncbi:PAS domain-containing protein [Hymenobacter caeli]|uniref:histidine kinase n=1 Tax=Hymenobacter caeli TaxID=2735894 RepID=A0ABX2FS64_9BACT|nr:PAS domain-containing sensor histidine kinase [Hymenobacter caeli]NRT19299.1 PAS domain S-box-containing protein [Hymenobacter caeli]
MNNVLPVVESEQRFRSLFDHNPDLVLFQDAAGLILDANPAFLAFMGEDRADVLGRPLTDFLPPALHALFNEKLREACRGHMVQFDVAVPFAGEAPTMLSVTKIPLMVQGTVAGVHVVASDVTEQFASHQTIRDQAHKLNTIFESITDAFFLMDREWRFTYVNSEMERLLNVQREHVIGRDMWEVFPEEKHGAFHRQYQHAFETDQAVHFEAFFAKGQRWLDVKAFPSQEGLSVYFADVTEKVQSQQELYRQHSDLQQFTYIVSHNLRAPLANALGLADLLGSLDKHSADYELTLKHLQASTQQLDAVLRDMNTILSIRDKQGVAAAEPVLLAAAVEQACLSLAEPLAQCGGDVVLDVPAGLHVLGHRAYLHSIFFNLLSNAVKYRAPARALRVGIAATARPDGGVRVAFADNGSGFDLEKAGADVFRLYKRFHSGPAGRGMGLYLVKAHVEAMGGRVEVQSALNEGTQFVLYFP